MLAHFGYRSPQSAQQLLPSTRIKSRKNCNILVRLDATPTADLEESALFIFIFPSITFLLFSLFKNKLFSLLVLQSKFVPELQLVMFVKQTFGGIVLIDVDCKLNQLFSYKKNCK